MLHQCLESKVILLNNQSCGCRNVTQDTPDCSLDNFAKVGLVLGHRNQLGLHLSSDCLPEDF